MGGTDYERRRFVSFLVGVGAASVAGCTGSREGAGTATGTPPTTTRPETDAGAEHDEAERPAGVSEAAFVHGPVPDAYRRAVSQGGEQRDPERLQTKEAVRFGEADESEFAGPGQNCGNCAEYIPDMNGDGFGACARVEGYIDPEDWCTLWESLDEHDESATSQAE